MVRAEKNCRLALAAFGQPSNIALVRAGQNCRLGLTAFMGSTGMAAFKFSTGEGRENCNLSLTAFECSTVEVGTKM